MAAVIHSSDAVGKRFSDLREFRGLRFHRHLTRLDEVEATVDVDACANENEPCHAPRRGLPSERLNLPICRHFLERMMGLEPTTFCMARRTHLPPAAIAAKSRAGSLHSVHFELGYGHPGFAGVECPIRRKRPGRAVSAGFVPRSCTRSSMRQWSTARSGTADDPRPAYTPSPPAHWASHPRNQRTYRDARP